MPDGVLRVQFISPAWHYSIGELIEAIPTFSAQYMSAVEIIICNTDFLDFTDALEVDRLKRSLESVDIMVNSIHAPFGRSIDISSFDDQIHEQGVASVIKAIEFTRALGAQITVVHAGDGKVTANRKKRLDRAAGIIRELAVLAEDAEVILAVENQPPGYISGNADEMLHIIEAANSDSVGICFDTGHANLTGRFEEEARRLLPLTVTMHLHDNDGSKDQHLFPGQGIVNWRIFSELFQRYCPDAPLMIEARPPEGWDWPRAFNEVGKILAQSVSHFH